MDPFDRHRASPAVLAEREHELAELASEVVDIEVLTDAAFDPAVVSWEGIAAAELRAAPRPVRDRAHDVASRLMWAATAIKVWSEHVRSFNTKVDALRGERAAVPVEVERLLAPWTALPLPHQDLIRERKREELIRGLYRRWGEVHQEHIHDGSREVAGMLERGPTWDNLVRSRELGALSTGPPLLRFFAAEWQAEAVPLEALRLAALFNDPEHQPTTAEIEQLHRLLERYAEQPGFWDRFLAGLGPAGLLTLTGRIALHTPDGPAPELGELVGGIQAMLGTGLALATTRRGPVGSAEWLVELTRAGRRRFEIVTVRPVGPVTLYGYQLLGPLLRSGAYDRRFLRVVGGDLVDFELAQDGAGLWSGWLDRLGLAAGSTRLDWTVRGPDQPDGFDPVLGLLSALDRNPAGALDLLTGRAEAGLPRLDYLLTDRDWPPVSASLHQNLAYLDTHPGAAYPSPGLARLGEVLEQVARLDDPRAVTVVEQIVSAINTDEQAMGYPDGAVPGEAWTQTATNITHNLISPVLRESLAHIVADYIIDVNAAVLDSGAALPGGLGADFDGTHMVRFLADLGKDRLAHETVLAAETAYAATAYHFYLSGEAGLQPDGTRERLVAAEAVARSYGAMAGALDVGAATADWYAQWQRDLATNTTLADGYAIADLVVGAAADVVSAKAPGAGYAAGELTAGVLGELHAELRIDHSGRSTYRAAVLLGDGRAAAATLAEAAVYRSGLLDGLGRYGLLDAEGHPVPMSEWDDDARDGWEDYKRRSGRATAGALVDRAGVAYQAGAGRAESVLFGVVRSGNGGPAQ